MVTIAGTATVQLDLYSNWHAFTLPTGFSPNPRDFHICRFPGSTLEDGRYGAIDRSGAAPAWHQIAPSPSPLSTAGAPELGTFMARMTETGFPRCGRLARASGTDDWSFTVDELLRITASRTFGHQHTLGGIRHPRGSIAVTLTAPMHIDLNSPFAWQTVAVDPPPPGGPAEPLPPDDERRSGLSTIRVVISRE